MFLRFWNKKNYNLLVFGGSYESWFYGFILILVFYERVMFESDIRYYGGFY